MKISKINKMQKLFMNNSPWGEWKGSGSDSGASNKDQNKKPKENKSKNPDDFFKDFSDFAKKFFKKNFSNGSGNGGNNGSQNNGAFNSPKSFAGLIALGVLIFWLLLGFYKVGADENAVVMYFGKYYKTTTPGLNYHIPYPIGKVTKQSVTTVNTEEFGFSSKPKSDKQNLDAESLMLTGDENIVDIEFQVQWQIADIEKFVFNIAQPNQSIRKSAESAMREIIARRPIADALSDGKKKIEDETKDLLQQILDYYGAGVRVVLVQLRRVDPPSQVIDAFRDVQTAKADKEKEINQAQSYANDVVPRARGIASQMYEQAQGYKQEVVTNAEGEAGRFMSVYNQYLKARQVTKRRMYLETMEKIYHDSDKIFIDKSTAKSGVMPYFPLNEISGNSQQIKKQ